MIFGYARVSTAEQNPERQILKFRELGIAEDCIFVEKTSGKDFTRQHYQMLKMKLRSGDIIYLDALDRLGRNYEAIIQEWQEITQRIGADIVILEQEALFDSKRFREMGDLGKVLETQLLSLLSYVADQERKKLLTRQREGIAVAKAAGVRFGRPKAKAKRDMVTIFERFHNRELTGKEAAELTGVSESTFHRRYREWKETPKAPESVNADVMSVAQIRDELAVGLTDVENGNARKVSSRSCAKFSEKV